MTIASTPHRGSRCRFYAAVAAKRLPKSIPQRPLFCSVYSVVNLFMAYLHLLRWKAYIAFELPSGTSARHLALD